MLSFKAVRFHSVPYSRCSGVLASWSRSLPDLRCASLLDRGHVGGDTPWGRRHGGEIQWPDKVKVKEKEIKHAEMVQEHYSDFLETLQEHGRDVTETIKLWYGQGYYCNGTGTLLRRYRNLIGTLKKCYRNVPVKLQ